ncbi:hypothetical protein [Candidatus Electronema sp. PJ]|uniref:hypothetical protein n=1 Tax=Candidatus Electronema sp. PJ TaxID=3401572 RepID=UPI003AA817E3
MATKEFCRLRKELYSAEEEFCLAKLLSCRLPKEFGRLKLLCGLTELLCYSARLLSCSAKLLS